MPTSCVQRMTARPNPFAPEATEPDHVRSYRSRSRVLATLATLAIAVTPAEAQRLALSPTIGVYIPTSELVKASQGEAFASPSTAARPRPTPTCCSAPSARPSMRSR